MIRLEGRTIDKTVDIELGLTILDLALKHGVDWGFSCSRGSCARCRCQVQHGGELLGAANDAEWDRLEPDELEKGFRLGCQAVVRKDGDLHVRWKPYF